jgi:gentisate 1,2-dioxygenase
MTTARDFDARSSRYATRIADAHLAPLWTFFKASYRATAGSVVTVVRGHGRVAIGAGPSASTFDYGPKDIWVVPSWQPARIAADDETVLFSASDEPVHKKLRVWREQRGVMSI